MTREEAKEKLKTILKGRKDKRGKTETDEALEIAIKALEQEPYEDVISRQAYIERYRTWGYSEYGRKIDNEELAIRVAMSLPPVTPQPKMESED